MFMRIFTAAIVLSLVFILGCAEIADLAGDRAYTSSAANPEIATKVELGSKDQMTGVKIGARATDVLLRISKLPTNTKVTESDESNNEKTIIFLNNSLPDLIIEAITLTPENPSKSDNITFSVIIKNQGSGSASFSRVYFYLDGSSRGYQDVQRIDAGDTVTKTFKWIAQAGSHAIKAIIDEGNWIPESDETNNEKAVTFQILPPDLIIEEITWSPEDPVESDNVTFTVTIKNQGSGRADSSYVTYYINDRYLDSASVNPIDAGATDNTTFNWITRAGIHTLRVVADSNEKVTESDETNNEKTVTFPGLPDLTFQDIAWSPANPTVGETMTFTVTIKNQGSSRTGSFGIHFYIDDLHSGYQQVQEIDADDTVTKTFSWITEAGSHVIRVVADSNEKVTESDETNNEKTTTFSGALPSDLIVQDITWSPESLSVGETITCTVTIKNQGSGRAYYSFVVYYIDDAYLDSASVNPIDAGATDNKTFTWTVQAGPHTIKAVIDSNEQVAESDETNNEKTVSFPRVVDLIIEAIAWSPENPVESDNVTFTVTIRNQGTGNADNSTVAYYIDDAYLASASVNPIDSGATARETFLWTAQVGTHTIKAVADSNEQIAESDESNNEKAASFLISLPPAPTPEPAPTPGTEPQTAPAEKPAPAPSPEQVIWPLFLVGFVVLGLGGMFIMILLRSRRE